MHITKYTKLALVVILLSSVAFADVKIRQRVTVGGQGTEQTRMIKGSRERRETKMTLGGEAAGMSDMMPNVATITQCDARRTLQVNDRKKLYTVDPFDDGSNAAPQRAKAEPQAATRKGGIVTITYAATDTGERRQMFGLTARHLKIVQSMESSADSCGGAQKNKIEIDGWYADFSADFSCPIDLPDAPPPPSRPDCRDRIVFKRSGTLKTGFLLDGTMTMFNPNGTVASTIRTETLEITRSPLAAGLFDVGSDYRLASSSQELYAMPSVADMMAAASRNDSGQTDSFPAASTAPGRKTIGLNSFSGAGVGKVDQEMLRRSMANRLSAGGFAATPSASPQGNNSDYYIGVEILAAKQSKAAKIGGLFGKVTGNSDASKIGDSEAEVIVTAYRKDGKTVIGTQTSKQKVSGSPDDAARAAIEAALGQLIGKLERF